MPNNTSSQFRRLDYVKITVLGFALTGLWQSIHTIVLPIRLLDFVAESQKNTYLGLLTLAGLLLAMVVQPVAGAVSDRSNFRWGRRRPYILVGSILALFFISGIGFAATYAAIFVMYCLLQVCTNTAQGPYQAFIPELAPPDKHGLASGVKSLLEVVGGIVFIYLTSLFMDRYFSGEGSYWLWVVLGLLALVLLAAMLVTVTTVREPPAVNGVRRASPLAAWYRNVRQVLASRDLVWFLLSRLIVFMAFTTIQQFALYYLNDVIGVTNPAEATARFSVIAVVGMVVVVWPTGFISDRIGRRFLTIAAGLLGALGIGIIALSQEYGTILWAAAIIGIAMGIFNSANWALATDLVARGEEAEYLGIANMATAGGAALARLVGIGIDFFNGYSPGLGYTFMLLLCLAYFVVGSLLVLKIRQHR
jgi:Na+/melibiose symporter-like transporter